MQGVFHYCDFLGSLILFVVFFLQIQIAYILV